MTQNTIQQFQLRLPSDLKESIEKEAEKNNRSINAQIIFMLQNYENSEGRLTFIPIDVQMRLDKYQHDNNLKNKKETIFKLLNEALQSKDTIKDIMNHLYISYEKQKNLKVLAEEILLHHVLIKELTLSSDEIRFVCKNNLGHGTIKKTGELFINNKQYFPKRHFK